MRFRSILGAFIFITAVSFIALVIFVQTKTFGRLATRIITDLTRKHATASVSVKSIGISMFPPGIELNQVKVSKEIDEESKFEAEFGKLGMYVGLVEIEERKFSLGEIYISDSLISFTSPEKEDEELPEEIDKKIIDDIFNATKKLPLRIDRILIENSKVVLNHDFIEAKRLKIFKRNDSFMTRFHLANFHPNQDKNFSIDEIWGDAEISRKNISLHRLRIQDDVHTLLIKGKIKNYPKLKNADVEIAGESSIYIQHLEKDIPLPDLIKLSSGYAHISFKGEYLKGKLAGRTDISISNLDSSIIKAEQLIASLEMNDSAIRLNGLSLKNGKERARLLTGQEIYNINSKSLLNLPLNIEVEQLNLNNALRILPSLNVIKGQLSGVVEFEYKNANNLEFRPKDGFVIQNLGLVVGENDPFNILMIKKATISSSSFSVVNNEFQMDALVKLKNSLLDVHGFVNSKHVGFRVGDAVVDLEDFGNIANLDIKGKGILDLSVIGPLKDASINLKGKTSGFEVLGYKLGQADKDISIELGDSSVIINKMESIYRNTPISGTGVINYGNKDIALGINSQKANFFDLKEILNPIFSKLDFLPSDLELNGKVNASIYGKTSLEQLKVKSEIQFKDLLAYGEAVNSGNLKVELNNQTLSLKELSASKGSGQITGDFSYSIKDETLDLNYQWRDISLNSLNASKKLKLNVNGFISGELTGKGTTSDYLLGVTGKIDKIQALEYKFEDSLFDLKISPKDVSGKINLFGSFIKSDFLLALDRTQLSKLNVDVDIPEVKPITVAFFGQHLEPEAFSGSVEFHLDTKFRGNLEEVDLKANLAQLVFNHSSYKVNYASKQPQFLIEKNKIRYWNLDIRDPDLFVHTEANGEFGEKITLVNDVHFSARIFEILLAPVLSAEGYIRNSIIIDGKDGDYQMTASSKGNNLKTTLEGVPFPINNLDYSIEYSDKRLTIQDLKTSLDNGVVGLKGDVFFDNNYPDINLKYFLDKAEIPVFNKSVINLSGEGIILGNDLPYNVAGEIIVNKASIVNELNEFSPKSSALSQVRFLPQSQDSALGKMMNLNLNVKIDNPVRISNSMMDVNLRGEIMLLGSPTRPRGEGRLFSPANTSRIFFKNNEYFLTNADLNFDPKKEISNPDFDVQALTYISSYKVYAKAYGDLERFNFDLTSDPTLPRNSILSLIAFGYTDEMQNTLEQRDQQNLTQVGVGSFVFDRFKINDILNKQFGLQVNLGTVLEQSQTDSLLSGRTQEGQGTIGRTRSATKIELKKRLDEALNLSVSSTMGGSIGQRQSMNLNYSLSKKVQLEGVYELKTAAEGEEDIIDNSIGGDLKFRWTFK